MSEMPERIDALRSPNYGPIWWEHTGADTTGNRGYPPTQYVRADIADALRHELERLCDVIDPAEAEIVERVLNDPGRTDQAEDAA